MYVLLTGSICVVICICNINSSNKHIVGLVSC